MIARYSFISLVCHGAVGAAMLFTLAPSPLKNSATEVSVIERSAPTAPTAVQAVERKSRNTSIVTIPTKTNEVSAVTESKVSEAASSGNSDSEVGEMNGATSGKLSQYYLEIRSKVAQQQVYPRIARMQGLSGRVLVAFVLSKNGNIAEAKVQSSSGHEILDRSAVEAVKSAQPFPVFPEFFNRDSVRVEIPLVYNLRI
ncbi:MAG: energy transducer TonB [Bdellovibrio sp.]